MRLSWLSRIVRLVPLLLRLFLLVDDRLARLRSSSRRCGRRSSIQSGCFCFQDRSVSKQPQPVSKNRKAGSELPKSLRHFPLFAGALKIYGRGLQGNYNATSNFLCPCKTVWTIA
jgi:hypothetical protein